MSLIVLDCTKRKFIISGIDGCFSLFLPRFLLLSERLMRKAQNFDRKRLMGMGVCFGKFSKTGIFKLHISALDIMAQYARVCKQSFVLLLFFFLLHPIYNFLIFHFLACMIENYPFPFLFIHFGFFRLIFF